MTSSSSSSSSNYGYYGSQLIAPVVRLFPQTISDYDNSNIPFSMTVTPLGAKNSTDKYNNNNVVNDDDDDNPHVVPATAATQQQLSLLTNIPKCYHCGAPHSSNLTYERLYPRGIINTTETSYRRTTTTAKSRPHVYYCRLCNKTFQYQQQPQPLPPSVVTNSNTSTRNRNHGVDIDIDDVNINHHDDEKMDTDTTTTTSVRMTLPKLKTDQSDTARQTLQRHKTQKIRNTTTPPPPLQQHHPSSTSTSSSRRIQMEMTQVFDLPLRLPQSQQQSSLQLPLPLYRIPAMLSPIIWYICLDGGTKALHTLQYWQQVAMTIQYCIDTAPSHVHIAILIASQKDTTTQLYNSNNNNINEEPKQLSIYDLHHPPSTTSTSNYGGIRQLPKINTYSSDELICTEHEMIHSILYHHTPVPYHSEYQHTIRAALRSLVDYPNTIHTTTTSTYSNGHTSSPNVSDDEYRCPIGWVTEVLLTSFQYGTIHVGHRNTNTNQRMNSNSGVGVGENDPTTSNINNHTSSSSLPPTKLVYAGMKLTFFLCDRPAGIASSQTMTNTSTPNTIYLQHPNYNQPNRSIPIHPPPIGERYTYHSTTSAPPLTNHRNAELTPSHLQHQYHPSSSLRPSTTPSQQSNHNNSSNRTNSSNNTTNDVHAMVEYYADLGRECSDMAMGVDLILLYDSTNNNNHNIDDNGMVDFALPLYQSLSEKSGAPGPVVLDLAKTIDHHNVTTMASNTNGRHDTNDNNNNDSSTRLYREVLSRTPWQAGRVFGAELRVRLSSGYMVDPNTVSLIPNVIGPQLAPIYNEAGCMGPACSVHESSQLWRMGTTDPYTSYTFDLTMIPHTIIRDHVTIDDGLVVAVRDDDTNNNDGSIINLYPIIQICCAYTTIIAETDSETGIVSYYTVRQMRITNRMVPLASSVEALYASIDTEALAVVLFHRIALANYQDGMIAAATLTQQWLQCLLICIYKSAMEQFQIDEQNRQLGYERYTNQDNPYDKSHRYFYPGERLLFLEGELSAEDVLLAQGHERLRPIVLMVYLLLQCDAFRCSSDYFCPSHDIRSATISHLSSMTPASLTRCIAPRIQLWESGIDIMEPIYDVLDLRSDAIQAAILECTSTSSTTKGGRSSQPGLILFLDTPEQIVIMDARYVNNTNLRHSSAGGNGRQQQQQSPSKRSTASDEPLVVGIGLQNAISDAASSYRVRPPIIYELQQSDTWGERTLLRLVDHLIEDTYHIASQSENFNDWKVQIAQDVQMRDTRYVRDWCTRVIRNDTTVE